MKKRTSALQSKLLLAIQQGATEDLKALLPQGWDFSQCLASGRTALGEACIRSDLSTVELILSLGADINDPVDLEHNSVLHAAVSDWETQDAEILRYLIAAGAKVDSPNKEGETALMKAAEMGPFPEWATEAGRILLEAGADVKAESTHDWVGTALHIAITTIAHELVELLLQHGADPNRRNKNGCAPIHKLLREVEEDYVYETESHDWAVAEEILSKNLRSLLNAGADINAKTSDGEVALGIASQRLGLPESILLQLVSGGADLDIDVRVGDYTLTPLIVVALLREPPSSDLAIEMIRKGTDLRKHANDIPVLFHLAEKAPALALVALKRDNTLHSLTANNGTTLLMYAALGGSVSLVKRLVSLGCDPAFVHPTYNVGAHDVAEKQGNMDVCAYLESL